MDVFCRPISLFLTFPSSVYRHLPGGECLYHHVDVEQTAVEEGQDYGAAGQLNEIKYSQLVTIFLILLISYINGLLSQHAAKRNEVRWPRAMTE